MPRRGIEYPICDRCQGHREIVVHRCGYRVLCPKCRGTGWQPRLPSSDPRPLLKIGTRS